MNPNSPKQIHDTANEFMAEIQRRVEAGTLGSREEGVCALMVALAWAFVSKGTPREFQRAMDDTCHFIRTKGREAFLMGRERDN